MEYVQDDFGPEGSVTEDLKKAADHRHWLPENVAQAAGMPVEKAARHLEGEEAPSTEELVRYSAVLGLSRERLLAKAAKEGVCPDVRQDTASGLVAAHELLADVWPGATPDEREQLFGYLQELSQAISVRSRE